MVLRSPLTGVDFDVKVRCNALPATTAYNYAATSSNAFEFLQVPFDASCTSGHWFIAVYSYNGFGYFNFVASRMKTSMMKSFTVGIERQPTPVEEDIITNGLVRAGKVNYAATMGQHVFHTFEVFPNVGLGCPSCGGSACDICFHQEGTAIDSSTFKCHGRVEIAKQH